MKVECSSTYQEGYSAYLTGIIENPYEQDTPANYAWREGWLDAEHDTYIDYRDYLESLDDWQEGLNAYRQVKRMA